MKGFRNYTPPSARQLADLKARLDLTGNELADLVGVADGRQWRKYTGGEAPREMSPAMLFMLAARLELSDADIERITQRMRTIGATFEYEEPASE